MSFIVDFDSEKCTGCGACAIACMDYKDIDLKFHKPLRQIITKEWIRNGITKVEFISAACMHCEDAPCADICPRGCIYKNKENGLTDYDNSLCVGCKVCASVCQYNAISFDSNHKMQKCTGCIERLELELLPSCCEACPQKAIIFMRNDEMTSAIENISR
ncbi:4Fe-4S dicluster domain-containing protein [Clostridium sp. OS1-26]|uniref:4Fe-4S dicluster domain-containing protein n=1 Tax=Clostridium sp. OS1-26 TaxID=3070681 RepID=UPI0027DF781D|nr:4Fe-4S dicluster domain-containing protein [Clostridium sp. OS1-26]WML32845.1 4Fe-4S dicluster domain-containing protein [Clostridium sp. OS1-26]